MKKHKNKCSCRFCQWRRKEVTSEGFIEYLMEENTSVIWEKEKLRKCLKAAAQTIAKLQEAIKRHELEIGKYTLSLSHIRPETHLWIELDDGEGSEFPISDIAALIDKYYEKNF